MARLNIIKATEYPKASRHVEEMIDLTRKLLEKGYAYEKFRSIYFDISRFKDYGKLSRIDLDKIKIGKTVDLDQYEKENPRDFTLMKRSTLSELRKGIFCETQWGNVRPSWHTECSAMALKYLGENYDIHTSGADLIFPHHENTIAVIKALKGKVPANYWLHNEPVMPNGKKSHQTGETGYFTLKELYGRGYTGREIRYWLLSRHYRKPLYFSWHKLDMARNTLAHLDSFTRKLYLAAKGPSGSETDQLVYDLRTRFGAAMDDDLNIAPALAALFQFARQVNRMVDRSGLSPSGKEKILQALKRIDALLGVMELGQMELDENLGSIIREREDAREKKDWKRADEIRQSLQEMGIEVIDTHDGPFWRKIT